MERNQIPFFLKTEASSVPTVLSVVNGDTITYPYDVVTPLIFTLLLQLKLQKKNIKYPHKHFLYYLSNEGGSTIFLKPTDKDEKANIVFSLNSSKASCPSSTPCRKSFLLKNETSMELADLFNLSFMTGVFSSTLKTAKVVPVFKKDSKLDFSNLFPTSLLSNIEKILEKHMYKRLHTFLNNNSIIYNFQFGFRNQYSTPHTLINITGNVGKTLDDGKIQAVEFWQTYKKLFILSTTRYRQQN